MIRYACSLGFLLCSLAGPLAAELTLDTNLLRVVEPAPPTLSNLDPIPENDGIAGALTGLDDNLTTGKFLDQSYTLETTVLGHEEDVLSTARDLLAQSPYLLVDAAPEILLAIADLDVARDAVLFNVSSGAAALRSQDCRTNVLHTAASDAMRTDALAQLFVQKRWTNLTMIAGSYQADQSYAEAMRGSLAKFGLDLKAEKAWAFDADMRRSAAQEIPLFTQEFGDYDALIIADEVRDFGRYVLYNTWEARPIAGSEGLSAAGWSPVIEQWGAAQLQSRFSEQHSRDMTALDYAAWAAMRSLGEAMTRTNSNDPTDLRGYMLSPEFELAGFKGRPLSFRTWNGQLRQPIAIAHPRALVAQAPLDGFLHQRNELDTLGLDQTESQCEAFE